MTALSRFISNDSESLQDILDYVVLYRFEFPPPSQNPRIEQQRPKLTLVFGVSCLFARDTALHELVPSEGSGEGAVCWTVVFSTGVCPQIELRHVHDEIFLV